MYEHLRTEFSTILGQTFNTLQVQLILANLDRAVMNYEITEKSTALDLYSDGIPREVNIYLNTLRLEGKSEKTIKLYGLRLNQFFEEVKKPIQFIETNDIRLYMVKYQSQHNIKDVSLEKIRQILNVFFQWCTNEEYIQRNPCGNIKKIKCEETPRKALTRFQLEKLRRACRDERDRAIVEVLYSTGARVTELVNMRISEYNKENNSIEVLGKGRKYYTVYFNETAQIALDEYFKVREDDTDYLIVNTKGEKSTISTIERTFQRLSKICGFYVCPHTMRHTFATFALQGGASIDVVQKALNHSSVATTQRYAETSKDDVIIAHKKYVV